jgi:hypothetical protein
MDKDFDVKKLDIDTLKFAIEIAWGFEFMCKKTKQGRVQAECFSRVEKTLQHYLIEAISSQVDWGEL